MKSINLCTPPAAAEATQAGRPSRLRAAVAVNTQQVVMPDLTSLTKKSVNLLFNKLLYFDVTA